MSGLSSTFHGSLLELAETGSPVTVLTRAGSNHRGTVAEVSADAAIVRTNTAGLEVLLRSSCIEGIREVGPGHNRTIETAPQAPNFATLLDRYADTRERLALTVASGNKFMGHVRNVGDDQLILELDGCSDTMTIPVAAIDEVVLAR